MSFTTLIAKQNKNKRILNGITVQIAETLSWKWEGRWGPPGPTWDSLWLDLPGSQAPRIAAGVRMCEKCPPAGTAPSTTQGMLTWHPPEPQGRGVGRSGDVPSHCLFLRVSPCRALEVGFPGEPWLSSSPAGAQPLLPVGNSIPTSVSRSSADPLGTGSV